MTANQRKRPSRNNRAVQLTSEQLVEAKTLDLKAHHSFKTLWVLLQSVSWCLSVLAP